MSAITMRISPSPQNPKTTDEAAAGHEALSAALHVALLRGINVGGRNQLPMRELAALFAGAGCREVRTYLQSGNVVFASEETAGLEPRLAGAIEAQFGMRVPVVVRSAEEMRQAVRGNPFVKARVPEEMLHVYFLADAPDAAAIKGLDAKRSPEDTFVVAGREIYLHLPSGVARTKLTNVYFDKALGTVSTMRNWRTCLALTAML